MKATPQLPLQLKHEPWRKHRSKGAADVCRLFCAYMQLHVLPWGSSYRQLLGVIMAKFAKGHLQSNLVGCRPTQGRLMGVAEGCFINMGGSSQ